MINILEKSLGRHYTWIWLEIKIFFELPLFWYFSGLQITPYRWKSVYNIDKILFKSLLKSYHVVVDNVLKRKYHVAFHSSHWKYITTKFNLIARILKFWWLQWFKQIQCCLWELELIWNVHNDKTSIWSVI